MVDRRDSINYEQQPAAADAERERDGGERPRGAKQRCRPDQCKVWFVTSMRAAVENLNRGLPSNMSLKG